jgi:acyl transferase domain-containing protein/acyl-CoA synthetase (AMP-forming)/AMP-acid ligase II/acyl carrier protein
MTATIDACRTLADLLALRGGSPAGRLAYRFLVDGEVDGPRAELTFAELKRRANAVGHYLATAGAEGERVLLLLPPGLEFICGFLGAVCSGAVAVPVPSYSAKPARRALTRLRGIVADCGVRFVLTTSELLAGKAALATDAPELEALRWLAIEDLWTSQPRAIAAMIAPETIAFLQYTSGSTGSPKGVAISHGNLLHNFRLTQATFDLDDSAQLVSWLPPYHDMGLIFGILYPLYLGATGTLLSPLSFIQRPMRWLEAIAHIRGSFSASPNFGYDLCVERATPEQVAALDLSSWAVAVNGAERVRQRSLDSFAATFAGAGFRRGALSPGYGLAEACLIVTATRRVGISKAVTRRAGRVDVACGRPQLDSEVLIVDAQTRLPCAKGETGEIWLRSPSVARGYWNRAEESAATFGARLANGDGPYLRTGDLGFVEDHDLYVVGRDKDIVIIRGANHHPEDIEQTVDGAHDALRGGIAAAFSIDVEDEERLVVVAETETMPAGEASAVCDAIRRAVADAHDLDIQTVALVRRRQIPRTTSGKVRRRACREAFEADQLRIVYRAERRRADAERPAARPHPAQSAVESRRAGEIAAWLTEQVAAKLGIVADSVSPRVPFSSLGIGSKDAVALSGELQEWLGVGISPLALYAHPTIERLAEAFGRDTQGPARASAAKAARPPESTAAMAEDAIAIVGIGCRFPSAHGPEEYWSLLRNGIDAISEVPSERWSVADLYCPEIMPGKTNSRWGGFIDGVTEFDPQFFGLSTAEAIGMDPQHRLLLQVTWEACEDAGLTLETLVGSTTGVFVGITNSDYGRIQLGCGSVGPYAGTGSVFCMAANRISYTFDLRGPSLAIDTACSSSLVAVHYACESLRRGEATMALVGGVNLLLTPESTIALSQAGALSKDGRCHTFDARANGYVRGEGAGVAMLKPLTQAIQDNDRIYAVIRSTAVNQDGRSNGLGAPNPDAQTALMRRAYARAGIPVRRVQYVEAHGTGTALGDPIEARAVGAALAEGRAPDERCAIGSVKSNFGHLESAAGIAGLAKTALSLHHRLLPPSLHFVTANPLIEFDKLKLRVPTQLEPWNTKDDAPRVAGVNSFGVGGTNAHVVLEEAPARPTPDQHSDNGTHLLVISAQTEAGLVEAAAAHEKLLAAGPVALSAIAYTAAARRTHHKHRLAVVGKSVAELGKRIEGYVQGTSSVGIAVGRAVEAKKWRIAFVFPGQGTQHAGMARRLFETEPAFRARFEECDAIMAPYLGWSLCDELRRTKKQSRLKQDDVAQPMIFAIQVSLTAQWRVWGVVPAGVVGHSMGELAAAEAAGVLTLEQAAWVTSLRSRLIRDMSPVGGNMALVGLSMENAHAALADFAGQLHLAASNGPTASVVSGDSEAIETLILTLEAKGIYCLRVKTKGAGHSPAVEPIATALSAGLSTLRPSAGAVSFYSAVSGAIAAGETLGGAYWGKSMRAPVLFCPAVRRMVADGYDLFLELSPHPALSIHIAQVLQERTTDGLAVCALKADRDDREAILSAVGMLHVNGYPVALGRLYADPPVPVSLPPYPWQRREYWMEPDVSRALLYASGLGRRAAAQDGDGAAGAAKSGGAPSSIAEAVTAAWRSVLNVTPGLDDSFLDLGGTSVSAAQMLFELRAMLNRQIPVQLLFRNPTLAKFIAALEGGAAATKPVERIRRSAAERFPLSFQQGRAFANAIVLAYPLHLMLVGEIDVAALGRSVALVIERHDAFRMRFEEQDGNITQVVIPFTGFGLPFRDLSEHPPAERDAALKSLLIEIEADFNRQTDLPYRFLLIRMEAKRHVLSIAVDHVISDYWSMGNVLSELQQAYTAYRRGAETETAAPPIRYVDYAAWQRSHYTGDRLAAAIAYWRQRVDQVKPTLPRFAVRSRPAGARPRPIRTTDLALDADLTAAVGAAARALACTKRIVLLSALMALLQDETDDDAVCMPVLHANRDTEELQDVLGHLTDYHIIRVRRAADVSVRDYIAQVNEAVLVAGEEQAFSYTNYFDVQGIFRPFPIYFNFVPPLLEVPMLAEAGVMPHPQQSDMRGTFEVQVAATEFAGSLRFRIGCAADLEREAAFDFGERLLATIRAMIADLDAPLEGTTPAATAPALASA